MIKSLMSYMLKDYVRSYKYVVPLVFYLAIMGVLYSMKPVRVMDSYFLTAIMLCVLAAWITMGFIDMEDNTQQQLTILHLGNQNAYYICKVVFLWIFLLILSGITVIYPALRGFFIRDVTWIDITIALVCHAVISLLGISITLLFNSRLIKDRRTALMCLFVIIIVTIVQIPIIKQFSFLKYVILLFPPVYFMINALEQLNKLAVITLSDTGSIFLICAGILIYSIILIFVYLVLMKKKAF
jgi:hypothetical protein